MDDDIAETINFMMGQKLDDQCPQNCGGSLEVPKVNATIWEHISTPVRLRDLRLQVIQKSLVKGICAFAAKSSKDGQHTKILPPATRLGKEINAIPKVQEVSTPQFHEQLVGGHLKPCFNNWCSITLDPFILQAVRGYKIEFERETFPPRDAIKTTKINEEILNLQKNNVIDTCHHKEGEFLSEVFTRPKKNGGIRLIIDM